MSQIQVGTLWGTPPRQEVNWDPASGFPEHGLIVEKAEADFNNSRQWGGSPSVEEGVAVFYLLLRILRDPKASCDTYTPGADTTFGTSRMGNGTSGEMLWSLRYPEFTVIRYGGWSLRHLPTNGRYSTFSILYPYLTLQFEHLCKLNRSAPPPSSMPDIMREAAVPSDILSPTDDHHLELPE